MRHFTRSAVLISMAWALALVLAALGGCAALAPPNGDPSIRGKITIVTPGSDSLGAILVEETAPQGLSYDKASLTITKKTTLLKRVGDDYARIAFADLTKGTLVEVWITGAVAESYPVQAAADTLVVLE
jgi:hypothetical protein